MKIFHKATGEPLDREPVDARELINSGRYQLQPPTKEEMAAAQAEHDAASDGAVRRTKKSGGR